MRRIVGVGAALGIGASVSAAQPPAVPTPPDTARRPAADTAARDTLPADTAIVSRPGAFSFLGLDRLRLRSVGAAVGLVRPGQAVSTTIYSLQADYGEVWRGVRLVFVSSYWATRYRDEAVAELASQVRRVVVDPSRDDSVRIGRVRLADVSVGADARWRLGGASGRSAITRVIRPWVGGGFAAHSINVEGAPISGTFVERALDAAAIGLTAATGVDLSPIPNFQVTMQGRYDFLSGTRYASARVGASFVFGPAGAQ